MWRADVLATEDRWMGGAEDPFNAWSSFDRKLDESSWQQWHIINENHSFDEVVAEDGYFVCYRDIEYFTIDFGDLNRIEDLTADELYVVLTDVEITDDYTTFTEKQTIYFQLLFE